MLEFDVDVDALIFVQFYNLFYLRFFVRDCSKLLFISK